jgi:prepilin-type N-terminal cleavage/methylation domain-containing protein
MERLKRAFTLIELMTVIAIVCIMMSVLMPVLANARKKGYQTQCMSNLRQIGMGIADYSDTYDGYSPPAQLPSPYGHFLNYLFIDYFEGNAGIVKCPSVPDDESFNPYGGDGDYAGLKKASYIMNVIRERGVAGWSYLGARIRTPYLSSFGWCGESTRTPVRRNRVSQPSEKIQITDSASGLTNSSAALGILRLHETDHGQIDANENSVANAGERQVGFQHGFAFSALFGDLHLEPRKASTHEEWNAIQQ